MNRVLVVCTSFPPVNTTAIHRTLALVRHLRARDVKVLVLTMSPPKELPTDEGLLSRIPEGTEVLRIPNLDLVAAIKSLAGPLRPQRSRDSGRDGGGESAGGKPQRSARDWFSCWLQLPDPRLGWLLRSRFRAPKAIRAFDPEVIYSTPPMWSAHVLAWLLHRKFHRPWVADCRDPWRANPYRRLCYAPHDRVDLFLESRMVRNALAVVCNTPAVRRDFARRYPDWTGKFHTIPNGYDRATVADVLADPDAHDRQALRLVHTGSFYGPRSPVPFFQALAMIFRARPELRGKLKFVQVGENHYEHIPLGELAREFGVEDSLELTGSLGHQQAMREVKRGSVAIAASQDGVHGDFQIPRKFYEYYGLGKPILVWGGACRTIRELLSSSQARNLFMADSALPGDLATVIGNIVDRWQRNELPEYCPPTVDLSEDRMAGDLERLILQAAEAG